MAAGEKYVIEFIGDPSQFAPGANTVLAQLKKIETAAKGITTRGKEGVAVDQQKSVLAQKRRMDAFQELNTIQKIALLEERRLRIAERISSAQSRGLVRRSETLSQGLMALDGGITMLGGGGRGFSRRMRQANVTGVSDTGGGGGNGGGGGGGAVAMEGMGFKKMLQGMLVYGAAVNALRSVLSLPAQARELDLASKKTEEVIQKYVKLSQGATTTLGQVANVGTGFLGGLKKFFGEFWAMQTGGQKLLLGTWLEKNAEHGGIGPLKNKGKAGSNIATDAIMNMPTMLGGMGGSRESENIALQERFKKEQAAKRDHYVDQILDGIRDRIAADKQAYHERMEKRRQDRAGDKQFAYGGEVGRMIGSPSNGMFAAGAGAGIASSMLEIEKQTLAALRENVVATKKIAPEVAKLGINYFNNY